VILDVSQVKALAVTLNAASFTATGKAIAVTERGAMNVKKGAQALAPKGPHTPAYAASISYDMRYTPGSITAEIGPDKDRPQGALGNIFEYGTGDPPRAPIPHLGPALEAEADNFAEHIGNIADGIL